MFAYILKREEITGRYRKLQNEELHNFFFFSPDIIWASSRMRT